jgi:2-keto-4-pentenoate hydratase/2-oxohepta-3-ene-1,7-dioic acid hydratase in catechol pathway
MKLASITYKGMSRLGQIIDDEVYMMSWPENMLAAVRRGMTPSRGSEHFPISATKFEAPVRPGKIVAIGRNYADHAAETGSKLPEKPLVFAKFSSSIIGPNEPILWSTEITEQVDWEGELAVVIGKRARNVAEADALNYVYGYTIANDVSARDLQLTKDEQWTRGKSLDTFCPLGPWIVTREEIPDPSNLNIRTTVNGEVVQDSNTQYMVFKVPQLISYLSRSFTLEPGDLILTGTPSGVGLGMKPPRFLNDGDTVTITIEGIGELTNPCRIVKE